MVPLLDGVNVYQTLFAWPPFAAPTGAHGGVGSAWAFVFAVARAEFTVSLYGYFAGVKVKGRGISSFGGAILPVSNRKVRDPPALAGLALDLKV